MQADKRKQVVVSVRFDAENFKTTQAFAEIAQTTPNAVIRAAVEEYIARQVQSPGWAEARRQYEERNQANVELMNRIAAGSAYPELSSSPADSDEFYNQSTRP
ncbi:hypothetical protein ABUW04_00035 [Streptacidiphilus sp. N1-10]|uniref:CopG family transcriptional regulator n=1 Tax=Streptacidiphilus jeojiensis TaxID=3229225 RepID=A0ABV6XEH8_9ACTN